MKQPFLSLLFCFCIGGAIAQSPGIIVRPAAGIGVTPLTEAGNVKATGNSNWRIKYAFTDNKPVNGAVWYRLRTVDLDGTSRYSNVIRLVNTTSHINVLSVTPNPFESVVRVQVYSDKVLPTSIRLVDITGREMY